MARIRSFLGVGQALGYPSPLSALPQAMNVIRSTSIDFAENQLYPILVIRIGKPGRAFPPMEPHVQVSSHTAQMTNGKSRPLAAFGSCGKGEEQRDKAEGRGETPLEGGFASSTKNCLESYHR